MKKFAVLCLVCAFLLSACMPQTIRGGGIVVHADACETASYLSYYSDEMIVYVTRSGKKYHNADCSHLTDSAMPISLEQALAEGKTPCSYCHPPEEPIN